MSNVLIVDDENSVRLTLKHYLEQDEHEVHVAESVDSAFALMGEHAFDVIVTDIIMPHLSGVDLLDRISRIAPDIQVIMITGEPTIETQ